MIGMTLTAEQLIERRHSQFNIRASREVQDNFRSNWRKFNKTQIGDVTQAKYIELLIESCDGLPINASRQ